MSKIKALERLIKSHIYWNQQTVRFKLRISQNRQQADKNCETTIYF